MKKNPKVTTIVSLKRKLSALRKSGQKIALTNGCFDILHYGHASYLQKAKKSDRILIVGVNSDASVKRIKGPQRPINPQDLRAGLLAALECVDYVVIFEEDTPIRLIEALHPDVYIKGADWKQKGVVGSDYIKAYGGTIEFVDFIPGLSSTKMVRALKKVKS